MILLKCVRYVGYDIWSWRETKSSRIFWIFGNKWIICKTRFICFYKKYLLAHGVEWWCCVGCDMESEELCRQCHSRKISIKSKNLCSPCHKRPYNQKSSKQPNVKQRRNEKKRKKRKEAHIPKENINPNIQDTNDRLSDIKVCF